MSLTEQLPSYHLDNYKDDQETMKTYITKKVKWNTTQCLFFQRGSHSLTQMNYIYTVGEDNRVFLYSSKFLADS